MRGATNGNPVSAVRVVFQSTRPVRGATRNGFNGGSLNGISIHAPRAGRDDQQIAILRREFNISIHAPRAGRDAGFQRRLCHTDISIHAPRAGRDQFLRGIYLFEPISIHAPRAGRDCGFTVGRS